MMKETLREQSKKKSKSRKIKIGTILDADIYQQLKARAANEGRTISALIEEAVLKYKQTTEVPRELRLRALDRFLSVRFNITKKDLQAIMDEDVYDQ